jgi:hypothetical protein
MSTYTTAQTQTFTLVHAKYLASKVATDLKRVQRFYEFPSDYFIGAYETEMTELLKMGYLDTVTYGFQRNGIWIEPTLRYTAKELAAYTSSDDDPGRVRPGANISGAEFTSFLQYSSKWALLTQAERDRFKGNLPFQRGYGDTPSSSGYFSADNTYSSGGRSLNRSSLKSF